jgi:hypothetical protein
MLMSVSQPSVMLELLPPPPAAAAVVPTASPPELPPPQQSIQPSVQPSTATTPMMISISVQQLPPAPTAPPMSIPFTITRPPMMEALHIVVDRVVVMMDKMSALVMSPPLKRTVSLNQDHYGVPLPK